MRASRSSGPGGQHANKTSSRIEATFDVAASTALSDEQKRRIMARLGPRVVAVAQDARSQARNRELALERLAAGWPARSPSARHPATATRPTRAVGASARLAGQAHASRRAQARAPAARRASESSRPDVADALVHRRHERDRHPARRLVARPRRGDAPAGRPARALGRGRGRGRRGGVRAPAAAADPLDRDRDRPRAPAPARRRRRRDHAAAASGAAAGARCASSPRTGGSPTRPGAAGAAVHGAEMFRSMLDD